MEKKVNRWSVLVAAVVVNLCLGTGYAWGVFQSALLKVNEANGWQSTQTALAFSISFAMVPVAMIIFGPIVDKRGPKKVVFLSGVLFGLGMILTGFATSIPVLYATYGLLLGFGIGTGYGTATAAAVKWFSDKKGLAGGITAAGFGLGAVVLSPIIKSMIGSMGIYMTFRILGVILLVTIVAASFFIEKAPAPVTSANVATNTGDRNFRQMLKESNFWILWVVYITAAVSGMMIIGQISNIVRDYQFIEATLAVMVVGLSNTLGRFFWGAVSDKIGRYNAIFAMFVVSIAGLLSLAFIGTLGNIAGIIGIILIPLSFGGFLGSFPGITAENWGVKNAGSNYGWMFTAYGVAAIAGPMIAGSIYQSTQSYTGAFLLSIGMGIVGIVFLLMYMKKVKQVNK